MYKHQHLFFYTFCAYFTVPISEQGDLLFTTTLTNPLTHEHHFYEERDMLVAMTRKLSGWSGRLLEIYWVSSQLILRNPLWGTGRGAGWDLRTAGTLESRREALITRRSDRGWGNKPAQHLFARYFPLKIKLQFSVLLEKNRSEWRSWERCQEPAAFRMLSFCCGFQ